jgi:hypothetical protein
MAGPGAENLFEVEVGFEDGESRVAKALRNRDEEAVEVSNVRHGRHRRDT